LNERLAEVVTETSSPDGGVIVTVRGPDDVVFKFRDRAYRGYNETALAHQLEKLARMAYDRYTGEVNEVIDDYLGGDGVDDDAAELGQFRTQLERTVFEAKSTRGAIAVATRAFVEWKVGVAPGALSLPESDFVAELQSVAARLRAEQIRQTERARGDVYGFGWVTFE
jgi:hypothetical protein